MASCSSVPLPRASLRRLPFKCATQAAGARVQRRWRHAESHRSRLLGPRAAAAEPQAAQAQECSLQDMDSLLRWCIEQQSLPPTALEPAMLDVPGGEGAQRLGFTVCRPVEQGQVRHAVSATEFWGGLPASWGGSPGAESGAQCAAALHCGAPGARRCSQPASCSWSVSHTCTLLCHTLQVLLEIPGDLGITSMDVEKDPKLAQLAEGRSELVGLALWLLQERAKVGWLQACCLYRSAGFCSHNKLIRRVPCLGWWAGAVAAAGARVPARASSRHLKREYALGQHSTKSVIPSILLCSGGADRGRT